MHPNFKYSTSYWALYTWLLLLLNYWACWVLPWYDFTLLGNRNQLTKIKIAKAPYYSTLRLLVTGSSCDCYWHRLDAGCYSLCLQGVFENLLADVFS